MSKLDRIATFIQIVEANSFAAAARKQEISAAAISRQISALEAELGIQLLKRTTRHLALTENGRQYYSHCKKILTELAEAESFIIDKNAEPHGTLRITCSRYFAKHCLIPHLSEFMRQFPKITLRFELADRFPDLAQENIDILFGTSMEGSSELVRRRMITTRYVLCATPSYLKKYGLPKTPEDLSQHRYITHEMRKPANILVFKNKKITLDPVLWLNDTQAMISCALQDIGIVKLHEYVVNDALKKKQLIEILPEYSHEKIPVYLYYQKSRYLQLKIRCFIDFCLTKIKD